MRKFLIIITVFSFIAAVSSIIWCCMWYEWYYPKTYEYNLKLADDASLPADKANYLRAYLNDIDDIQGEPRWFFKRPDLDLKKQKAILHGLIQRFDDIASISPNEMAYQQGMQQLTGQEMDHQLDRISNIFESAKIRENPLFCIFLWYGWLIFGLILSVTIKI